MIRRYLLVGCFALLPLVVTVWVVRMIFSFLVDVFLGPLTWASLQMELKPPPYWQIALISIVGTILLLLIVGMLMGNFLGRQLMAWLDEIMNKIPMIKGIYGATKRLMASIQSGSGGSFKEVVLVEWPHPGSYTLGFMAHKDCSWVAPEGGRMLAVYIPTAPNPTSGYVIMIDREKVRPVDVTPEEAFTWAVSAGVVAPTASRSDHP
ncbi:MAG TPA: DUF502 domain-containing protein [Holophaga sp.]|nr:DUF502 domain-containing protein [Holophaga sp.]HPS66497.1 DUF502 domain-containing protein [Holophaga sp.]